MICPRCNTEMYDNRASKKNPKAPDFKCSDPDCKWKMTKAGWEPSEFVTAIWEPKGAPVYKAPSTAHAPTSAPQTHQGKEDAIAKAVALKAAVESHAKGDPFDIVLGTANKYLEWLESPRL